jgi:hypothetical protein
MSELTVVPGEGREGQPYVPRNFPSVCVEANWCGASFNRGLLRIHDAVSGPDSAEAVRTVEEIADVDESRFDEVITLRTPPFFGGAVQPPD